jgi:cell division protein FtsA
MAQKDENLLTVLDVGSAKTCALVVEPSENGLRYRGHGVTESRGSRKGVIVELDKAIASIERAVEEAEKSSGAEVENAYVGIGGAHVKGVTSRGGLHFGSRPHEITRDDIREAVEKSRAIPLPADREMFHLLPQEFILDDQAGVRDPAGMMGSRLEVRVHVVTASSNAKQNVVTAANRAGIFVDDVVFEALACADATLKSDERDLGVCLVDIGAGSTDIVVFHEGCVAHSGAVPVGGDHFTNDVAVGLRTPLSEAEKIKRLFGSAVVTRVPEANEIEVPAVGDRPSRLMAQRFLAEILEPRARELFELLRDNLRQGGVLELCNAGTVLTGGGSRLPHLTEIAESVLHKPSRLASPVPLARMPAVLAEPEFATVIGMAIYAHRARQVTGKQQPGFAARLKSMFARRGM